MGINFTPTNWTAGETPTAAKMNSQIFDVSTGIQAAWTSFTVACTNASNGASIASTSATGQYLRIGHTVWAHAECTLSASTTTNQGIAINLPVTATVRQIGIGTLALFGASTPATQTGIAYMAADLARLIVVSYTQGFLDGTSGQALRYSVTYQV